MPEFLNPFLLERLSRMIARFDRDLLKADRLLNTLFKEERIGSRDRPWIRDRFYYYIRHRLYIQALCREFPERVPEASHALFSNNIPSWLENARDFYMTLSQSERESIELNYPEWLVAEAQTVYSDKTPAVLNWLNGRAPTTLRINPLKMDCTTLIKKLGRDGISVSPLPYSPWGYTITDQESSLSSINLYKYGCFELQDESSQLVCFLVDPDTPTLLDACAGGGGKTLAIGSLQPATCITATDIREYKLKDIATRASFAEVKVELLSIPKIESRSFDTVLIDAPCSGSGVLRRNPEDRWRLSPEDLDNIISTQRKCLEQYSRLVKAGGELIYITCSFISRENEENIRWFLNQYSDFKLVDPRPRLVSRMGEVDLDPILEGDYLRIKPLQKRDVFFAAVLKKEE